MTEGLLLGLSAAVCWGLTDVTAALAGRRFGSLPTLAIAQAVSLAVLLLIGLVVEGRLPIAPEVAAESVFFGSLLAIGYVTMFAGLAIGPVSVVSPAVAAFGAMTVILSVIFLGETVAPLQWLGVAIGTIGVSLTALRFDGTLRGVRPVSGGVALAVVSIFLFAGGSIGLATPIRQVGWLDVVFMSRFANAMVVWVLLLVVRRLRPRGAHLLLDHPDEPNRRARWVVVSVGLLDMGGVISFGIGLQVSMAWIVGLASSFGPAVAVVVAVGLLGERLRAIQWLGLLAIAFGLVLIAVPGQGSS
jgi:drug/metabolite transporter (DMT)-like permease